MVIFWVYSGYILGVKRVVNLGHLEGTIGVNKGLKLVIFWGVWGARMGVRF